MTEIELPRSIKRRFLHLGIFQAVSFCLVFFLAGLLLFQKLGADILVLEFEGERLKKSEVEAISQLVSFEFGRRTELNTLKLSYFVPGLEDQQQRISDEICGLLWEKVTFIDELIYLDLLAFWGTSSEERIFLPPIGKEQFWQYYSQDAGGLPEIFDEEALIRYKRIDRLTTWFPETTEYLAGGSKGFVMPLYVDGSRWGVARLIVSTRNIQETVDLLRQRNESFQQTFLWIFILFIAAVVVVWIWVMQMVTDRLLTPLQELARQAEVWGQKLESPAGNVNTEAPDEVGFLGRSLVRMRDQLLHSREREKSEAERRRLQEMQLAQSEKLASIGVLSTGLAHEINNRLNPIRMAAARMQGKLSGDQEEKIGMILRNVDACSQLLSRLQSFAMPIEKATVFDLNQPIRDVLSFLSQESEKRGIVIRYQQCDAVTIKGNSTEIGQVVLNLVLNAIDAIDPSDGKGLIEIRLQKENDRALLEVHDNGPGMTEELKSRIFEPFFTTKNRAAGKSGTGLGLSVSHNIILRHKGDIKVRSTPRQGTTFRIHLPLAKGKPVPIDGR